MPPRYGRGWGQLVESDADNESDPRDILIQNLWMQVEKLT